MKLLAMLFWSMFAVVTVSSLARAADPTPTATQSDAKATTRPAETATPKEQVDEILSRIDKIDANMRTINTLRRMRGEYLAEQLVKRLGSKEYFVRSMAVEQLVRLKDRSVLPQLRELLTSDNADARTNALTVLAAMRQPEALEPLLKAAHSPDDRVAAGAIYNLGPLGDAKAVPFIVTVLLDKQREVNCRMAAASALGQIGGDDAIAAFLKIDDKDQNIVRVFVARALVEHRQAKGLALAKEALKDRNWQIRGTMVAGLGGAGAGNAGAIELLLPMLKDEDDTVAREAAQSLAKIGDASTIPLIKNAMTGVKPSVASECQKAIVSLQTTRPATQPSESVSGP